MAEQFDPTAHKVPEVLAYLETADADEHARVVAAERATESPRVGIVGALPDEDADKPLPIDAPEAPAEPTEAPASETKRAGRRQAQTTKGATFQEAAKAATPADLGYTGTSPERERTGMVDKGLSQANPAVMRGGAIPDPRPGVDDAEALGK